MEKALTRRSIESDRNILVSLVQTFFPDNMHFFANVASKNDPRAFYNAAAERGYYDEQDIRGTLLASYGDLFSEGRKLVFEDNVRKYSKLARIALTRFPELERGERISVSEIRERLNFLRENGYNVGAYNSMNKNELFEHLTRIKKSIRKCADLYCPKVLVEIDEANRNQIDDARSHL